MNNYNNYPPPFNPALIAKWIIQLYIYSCINVHMYSVDEYTTHYLDYVQTIDTVNDLLNRKREGGQRVFYESWTNSPPQYS